VGSPFVVPIMTRYTVQRSIRWLSRADVMRAAPATSVQRLPSGGLKIFFDRPRQEPPPLTSFVSPCGPANLWAKCRACAMGSAELFKFRPLDKDDAVPTVRKAVRGRCDGRPVGTQYNGR
jgi:hypothetical protein